MFDLSGATLPFDHQKAGAWARQVAASREWEYRPADPVLLHRFRRVLGAPDQPRNSGKAFLRSLNPLADVKQYFQHPRPSDGNTFGHKMEHVLLGRHGGHHCVAFQYGWSTVTGGNTPGPDQLGGTWSGAALHLGYRVPDLTVLPNADSWTLVPPPGARVQVGHPAVDAHYQVSTPTPPFAVDLLRSALGDLLATRLIGFHLVDESVVILAQGYLHRFPLDRVLDDLVAIAESVPERVRERLLGEQ